MDEMMGRIRGKYFIFSVDMKALEIEAQKNRLLYQKMDDRENQFFREIHQAYLDTGWIVTAPPEDTLPHSLGG